MAIAAAHGAMKFLGRGWLHRIMPMRAVLAALAAAFLACGCERADDGKKVRFSDGEDRAACADASCPKSSGGVSLQDLERTFCEIGTNGVPLGSGFLASRIVGEGRRYYVVSADHVFAAISRSGESLWFAFPGTNNARCVDIDIPKDTRWFFNLVRENGASDIAAFDLSSSAEQLAAAGAAFVDFSPDGDGSAGKFCLDGVRMIRASEFERNGLALGKETVALASAVGMASRMEDRLASIMVAIGSHIAKMPGPTVRFSPYSAKCFVIDVTVVPGHSGGPVFARRNSNGFYLIGMLTDRMPFSGKPELDRHVFPPGAFVTPLDGLEDLFRKLRVVKRLDNEGKTY